MSQIEEEKKIQKHKKIYKHVCTKRDRITLARNIQKTKLIKGMMSICVFRDDRLVIMP